MEPREEIGNEGEEEDLVMDRVKGRGGAALKGRGHLGLEAGPEGIRWNQGTLCDLVLSTGANGRK